MTTRKRNPSRNSFSVALKHAEKELALRLRELADARASVHRCTVEIPNLENMIRAMKSQLNPMVTGPLAAVRSDTPGLVDAREVPEGAGSIPANADAPQPQDVPDLNSLPGMEGEWT